MIDLMLNRARQQTGRFDLDLFAFRRLRAHHYRFGPVNFAGDFGKT